MTSANHRNKPRRILGDGPRLAAALPVDSGGCWWLCRRAAGPADAGLGTLTAQLLETRADHREVVSSSRTSTFATQLVDASADHCKIVGRTGSGHISSPLSVS